MARITLQIKNVVSLALATAASVAWGVGSKHFFDTPQKPWLGFVTAGFLLLCCQPALIFVESKEEEELSLVRKQRIEGVRQATLEDEKLSIRIQREIENGNLKDVIQERAACTIRSTSLINLRIRWTGCRTMTVSGCLP